LRERQLGIAGCPSDIQTRPGSYQGYQVAFGCLDRGDSDRVVIVRGLGKKTFRNLIGNTPAEDDDQEKNAWRRFSDNVRKTATVSSVDRSARIRACRSTGYAVELGMHDFRQVADAVRAIGEWLARMDVGGEVALVLGSRPEPGEPP
jgi:hypothetical protein